jgi:asparagine synthase (glutamine-hydrolysing)
VSSDQYFVWESMFGRVAIQKRQDYPQTFAFVQQGILYCGYGNLAQARAIFERPLHEVPERMFYDDEFLVVIVNCKTQTIGVQRDAFGTLPLFAGHTRNRLVIASSFEKVCTSLPQRSLHVNKLSLMEHLLMLGSRANTLFEEITVLYDRVRLVWDERYHIVEAPDARAVMRAQEERDAAAPLFVRFLEETLDEYWSRYTAGRVAGCDLSGGYDSSLIAGYLSDKQRPIITGTLVYPGEFGVSVGRKITAFLKRFPVPNSAVHMNPSTEYPLVDMAAAGTWRPFFPSQTLYGASIGKIADAYVASGATTIFTGIGGDELCQNISPVTALGRGSQALDERLRTPMPTYATATFRDMFMATVGASHQHHKSVPLLAYSVVQQNIAAYDAYISRGLWPVAPLADPRLFIYCQSLPIRYRTQKNLLKMYLQARAFPKELYAEGAKEHFSNFFDMAVAGHLREPMRAFFASSVLANEGLVSKRALLRALDAPAGDAIWIQLYVLLGVEVNLQTLGITTVK